MGRRRLLAVLCCLSLAVPAAALGSTPGVAPTADPDPCVGTMTEPANGVTVVSVQGMRVGDERGKREARLVAFGPRGEVEWVHHREGSVWSYDVDPRPDGTLFVVATTRADDADRGETVFYEIDPETGEVVWERTTDFFDTHDADMLDDERLLVANMRANAGVDGNRDRLLVYDRTTGEISWQWQFRDHFERDVGGNYSEDWTHVNDVDAVNDTHYLASPRNFDVVVLVNRTSGELEWMLGEPNGNEKLQKQHNPAYYESENGTPTVLVADSGNDRVVEFARRDDDWQRTWSVGNASSMDWPRDADRLPSGNTLVADSSNDRVFEVTPDGEVVWEVYAPWLVYEVERVPYGDEPDGATIADQNATGDVALHGDERLNKSEVEPCAAALENATRLADRRSDDDGGVGGAVGDVLGGDDGDDASDSAEALVGDDDAGIDSLGVLAAVAAIAVAAGGLAVGYRRWSAADD